MHFRLSLDPVLHRVTLESFHATRERILPRWVAALYGVEWFLAHAFTAAGLGAILGLLGGCFASDLPTFATRVLEGTLAGLTVGIFVGAASLREGTRATSEP